MLLWSVSTLGDLSLWWVACCLDFMTPKKDLRSAKQYLFWKLSYKCKVFYLAGKNHTSRWNIGMRSARVTVMWAMTVAMTVVMMTWTLNVMPWIISNILITLASHKQGLNADEYIYICMSGCEIKMWLARAVFSALNLLMEPLCWKKRSQSDGAISLNIQAWTLQKKGKKCEFHNPPSTVVDGVVFLNLVSNFLTCDVAGERVFGIPWDYNQVKRVWYVYIYKYIYTRYIHNL